MAQFHLVVPTGDMSLPVADRLLRAKLVQITGTQNVFGVPPGQTSVFALTPMAVGATGIVTTASGPVGYDSSEPDITLISATNNGDGTDTYVISGGGYGGTYTVSSAPRLAGRAILVVPAVWTKSGTTYTLIRPLWFDNVDDSAVFSGRVLEQGVEVAGDVNTYTYAGSNVLEYAYSAINIAGVETAPTVIMQAEAFPTVVQFRDGNVRHIVNTPTRKSAMFFRASVLNDVVNNSLYSSGNTNITNTTAGTTRFRTQNHVTLVNQDYTIARAQAAAGFSVIMAADLDNGITNPLTGATGLTYLVLLNVGGTWITAIQEVQDTSSIPTVNLSDSCVVGSFSAASAGTNMDMAHHFWRTHNSFSVPNIFNEAFNADGTIKQLPFNGLIGGDIPSLYMVGAGFNVPTNRGTSSGSLVKYRNPITVVNP